MDKVRAKFRLFKVSQVAPNGEQNPTVALSFSAVTHGSPENEQFFKWTPNASIELAIVSEKTASMFEVGKEYYVDFTPAE